MRGRWAMVGMEFKHKIRQTEWGWGKTKRDS
jgi:hypothetical protein